jgi:hypothetical protein
MSYIPYSLVQRNTKPQRGPRQPGGNPDTRRPEGARADKDQARRKNGEVPSLRNSIEDFKNDIAHAPKNSNASAIDRVCVVGVCIAPVPAQADPGVTKQDRIPACLEMSGGERSSIPSSIVKIQLS